MKKVNGITYLGLLFLILLGLSAFLLTGCQKEAIEPISNINCEQVTYDIKESTQRINGITYLGLLFLILSAFLLTGCQKEAIEPNSNINCEQVTYDINESTQRINEIDSDLQTKSFVWFKNIDEDVYRKQWTTDSNFWYVYDVESGGMELHSDGFYYEIEGETIYRWDMKEPYKTEYDDLLTKLFFLQQDKSEHCM